MRPAVRAAAGWVVIACAPPGGRPPSPAVIAVLEPQASGTGALLQAVSAPTERVVWVSGHAGAVLRTTNGGASWERLSVPGAETDSLQFRDIHAVNASVAFLLAAGPGAKSRIYKTADAGRTWRLQFVNTDSSAFYDCFAFWDSTHGVAVSDAVAGRFPIRRTVDGEQWTAVPDAVVPPAQPGEGAFAASGACVVAVGDRFAWVGTGAADTARVLATSDGGRTWSVAATPVTAGASAGIAALAFSDFARGLALGGRLDSPLERSDNIARTTDGGRSWRLAGRPRFSGPVYGAAVVPGRPGVVFAAGPKGLDLSRDDGATWVSLDTAAYWSVGFASANAGWAVGPNGRIVRLLLEKPVSTSPTSRPPTGRAGDRTR